MKLERFKAAREQIIETIDCMGYGELIDFAREQNDDDLLQAMLARAYYIGHGDGSRSERDFPHREDMGR